MAAIPTNLLYFGDNLTWLRDRDRFPTASIDLIYLDPPFNSNRNYNVLFRESDVRESEAQIHAFEDTWSWDNEGRVQAVFDEFWLNGPERSKGMLKSLIDALGHNDVTAYLTMMAPRLVELHRCLKPNGTLYLHCDPTASHYLKILLDSIFGATRFVNEVIWQRATAHHDSSRWRRVHDVLLVYSPGKPTWNTQYGPYDQSYIDSHYNLIDEHGRRYQLDNLTAPEPRPGTESDYEWKGHRPPPGGHWRYSRANMERLDAQGRIYYTRTGRPRLIRYLDEMPGAPLGDVWTDIPPVNSQAKERLGYPTQKPLALLERIIAASSSEGDILLDPFCGCGTAVHAAHKLRRQWIGIDITPIATNLIRDRLQQAFPGLTVPIEGWPVDMAGAVALAAQPDKYHFQDWAVIQCGARPVGEQRRKGADRGIDGVIPFSDFGRPLRGVVSVKAGATGPNHVRELAGVVNRDPDTAFGVLISLYPPTRAMIEEALSHGVWESAYDGNTYPRIQIFSAQDLIDGKQVRMPAGTRTHLYARPERERRPEGTQPRLA